MLTLSVALIGLWMCSTAEWKTAGLCLTNAAGGRQRIHLSTVSAAISS